MMRNFILLLLFLIPLAGFSQKLLQDKSTVKTATSYLDSLPVTITASKCVRSDGGSHDFYSEGDYWWPDPKNPEGPYIRRDGQSNPNNFIKHRLLVMRLSEIVGKLGAAYSITEDSKYAAALIEHCKAWFVNQETMMNPDLSYAQAIKGKVSGRGIGIIDTIHLIEVALAIKACQSSNNWQSDDYQSIIRWFEDYLKWLTTDDFGKKEMLNGNNHSTTWALQVAAYAHLVKNDSLINAMDSLYKNYLLPTQMAANGSFPLELKRTKPYAYSLFNLDAMASLCQILSQHGKSGLFDYVGPDNQSLKTAAGWMYPMLKDKSNWTYPQDTQYWNVLPWQSAGMLFIGLTFDIKKYINLWVTAETRSDIYEIRRNTYVRNPILWISN